jgi:hypothetical protein
MNTPFELRAELRITNVERKTTNFSHFDSTGYGDVKLLQKRERLAVSRQPFSRRAKSLT